MFLMIMKSVNTQKFIIKIYNKNFNPDNKKFLCKNFNSKLINFYNHAYYYLKK